MYLNYQITPYKSPANFNTTAFKKSNFQHHKYKVLKVLKSNKIQLITSNQQHLLTFVRNEKHAQYIFKSPYKTLQATRFLQHNNSPQIQFPTSQVYSFTNI